MLFRRRKRARPPEESRRRVQRTELLDPLALDVWLESPLSEVYQGLLGGEMSVVQLDSPFAQPVPVRLDDLCIQGASVLAHTSALPAFEQGLIVGLYVAHQLQGWVVRTPGYVRGLRHHPDGTTRLGLEFVNRGNLYSQLEDPLGAYFNRRRAERIQQDRATLLRADLRAGHLRLRANVVDLSADGMGAVVRHAEAAPLKPELRLAVRLHLNGGDELVGGEGVALRKVRLPKHPFDVLGVRFDRSTWSEDDQERLATYVHGYLAQRLRWAS